MAKEKSHNIYKSSAGAKAWMSKGVYIHSGKTASTVNYYMNLDMQNYFSVSTDLQANLGSVYNAYRERLTQMWTAQTTQHGGGIKSFSIETVSSILDSMQRGFQRSLNTAVGNYDYSAWQKIGFEAAEAAKSNSSRNSKAYHLLDQYFQASMSFTDEEKVLLSKLFATKNRDLSSTAATTLSSAQFQKFRNKSQQFNKICEQLEKVLNGKSLGEAIDDMMSLNLAETEPLRRALQNFGLQTAQKTVQEGIVHSGGATTTNNITLTDATSYEQQITNKVDSLYDGELLNIFYTLMSASDQDIADLKGFITFSVKSLRTAEADIAAGRTTSISMHTTVNILSYIRSCLQGANTPGMSAVYNTIAFSKDGAHTEPTVHAQAERNYHLITACVLQRYLLEFITGTGNEITKLNNALDFAQFLVINGRVYSTLLILLQAMKSLTEYVERGDYNRSMSKNGLIYIGLTQDSDNKINNAWISNDEKQQPMTLALQRSGNVKNQTNACTAAIKLAFNTQAFSGVSAESILSAAGINMQQVKVF